MMLAGIGLEWEDPDNRTKIRKEAAMMQPNRDLNITALSRRTLLLGASAALIVNGQALGQPAPATGDAKAPKISLRFATSYAGVHPMAKPVRERVAQFLTHYPNVTIVTEESPGDSQLTKIKLDATADRLPDLFNYWRLDPSFGLDQVARAGRLADLTDWVKTDATYKGLFDQASWDTATLDGKIYGIPVLMYYVEFLANKAVFDRAGIALPQDWASLQTAVKALKAKGEIPWAISIGNDSEGRPDLQCRREQHRRQRAGLADA